MYTKLICTLLSMLASLRINLITNIQIVVLKMCDSKISFPLSWLEPIKGFNCNNWAIIIPILGMDLELGSAWPLFLAIFSLPVPALAGIKPLILRSGADDSTTALPLSSDHQEGES